MIVIMVTVPAKILGMFSFRREISILKGRAQHEVACDRMLLFYYPSLQIGMSQL